MNLFDLAKRAFTSPLDVSKAQATATPYATGGVGASNGTGTWNFSEPRRGSQQLRRFARNNEFVQTAINRRKRQIGMARWRLVRRADPNAAPDPRVEKTVRDLLDVVNPKMESFRSLLDQVIFDLLVLDAGCIEKEKTLGGQIIALHAVDGATIAPDPDWDGTAPRATRYRQYIDGICKAKLRNDQLIYMMANPATDRVIGWSPLETLFRVVRAELYAEDFDWDMVRQTAPNIALYLGAGVNDQQRDKFIEYWENEVAGQKAMAVLSGGDREGKNEPKAIQLRSDTFEDRLGYKKWLATKIAAVFEMDLMVFNLSEAVQKSVGNSLTARTDEGANGVASLVAEYMTREIVWEVDTSRDHAFEFDDLNARDELAQAKIDQIRMSIGVTYPNELRARDGFDPVEWGEEPYAAAQSAFAGDDPGSGDAPNDSGQAPDDSSERGSQKSGVPFAAARPTRTAARSYLDGSNGSARANPSA